MKTIVKATLVLGLLLSAGNAAADAYFQSAYIKWRNTTLNYYVEQQITSYASVSKKYDTPDFLTETRYVMPHLYNWIGGSKAVKHDATIVKDGTGTFNEYDWDMLEARYEQNDDGEWRWIRKWQSQDSKSNYTCYSGTKRCYTASETQSYSWMDIKDDKPEARIDFKFYSSQSKPHRIEFNYQNPSFDGP